MANIGSDFPQSREARKAMLLKIKKNDPISTMKVPGKGVKNVYRIPLEYLSYNPHNTRFLAQAKTLEKRFGCELSDENPEHVSEIEDFIWQQKKEKNESTITSLIEDGQLQPGVVTVDGVLLSGNRRFRLLNEISRNPDKFNKPGVNLGGLQHFEAVILDEELSKKDIIKYESFYQYGTEDKVEYNAIQKYIAAYDQKKLGFTLKEIADNFMSITEGKEHKVKEWLEVYDLMVEYLDYIGETGVFTALETREEAFLNLRLQLNSFKRGRVGNNIWAYNDFDLAKLKRIFFDYIRLNIPTHDVRLFKQIFSDKSSWDSFSDSVISAVDENELVSYEKYRQDNPNLDESEVSKKRNNDYIDIVGKDLKKLYGTQNSKIQSAKEQELPLDMLKVIQQKIDKLEKYMLENDAANCESDAFLIAIKDILHRVGGIKQKVD